MTIKTLKFPLNEKNDKKGPITNTFYGQHILTDEEIRLYEKLSYLPKPEHKKKSAQRKCDFMGLRKKNMKKYKHVYCTACIHGKKLISSLNTDTLDIPKSCINCDPFNPEDSVSSEFRINYKESFSGWIWLTKWYLKEKFEYLKYKIRRIFYAR